MKKTMVYILALSMAFSVLLSGCGEKKTDRPLPTNAPTVTMPPETMLPDVEDGVVQDTDGIITDDDTGHDVDTDSPIHAGANDMEGNVSSDPDVNAAVEADRADRDNKATRP